MSDTLVVLQTVERELIAALERREEVSVVAMLRFAALRDRGRVLLALAGAPDAEVLEQLDAKQRANFAASLVRAAAAVYPWPWTREALERLGVRFDEAPADEGRDA